MFKKISVIGLGYIGLPTATMFASRKITVHGVDVNQQTVDTVNAGGIHIVEPDLEMVVKAAVKDGFLRASLEVEPADAFLIAVPTPFKNDHEPDISYIQSAAEKIAPVLQKGNLVILESTSPVGATEQLAEWLARARPDLKFPHQVGESADINVAHCPERVLPGQVMRELVDNDRIIGGMTNRCSARCIELYSVFVKGACIQTDARTAEMAKLTENSFRDVNIAFANELSILCDQFKIDVWELIKLTNRHPRVNILQPGAGVGGHCIAVDPWFIVHAGGEKARIIKTAREINDFKMQWVIDKIQTAAADFEDRNKRRPVVACMGLAFKPNIDDLRESPALKVFHALLNSGLDVLAVEPNLVSHSSIVLTDPKRGAEEADIVAFLVAHKGFSELKVNGLQLDFCGVRREATDQ